MASTIGVRRPLDSLNSDDETEDEEKQNSGSKPTEAVIAEADELILKKKVRRQKAFTEDVLTHPDGIQRIYEEFPVACKFRGRGSEAKDIKKLMAMYREWAFQLHPGLAFADILTGCESLGSKGKTRSCIQNLREIERGRYIAEVLDPLRPKPDVNVFQVTSTAPEVVVGESLSSAGAIVVETSVDVTSETMIQLSDSDEQDTPQEKISSALLEEEDEEF